MSSPIAHDGAFAVTRRDIEMYRKLPPETNYKAVIKECVKGFGAICFILFVILGWTLALSQPTCTHNYKTNITSC